MDDSTLEYISDCEEILGQIKSTLGQNRDEIKKCLWQEPAEKCEKALDATFSIVNDMTSKLSTRKQVVEKEISLKRQMGLY